MVKISTGVSVIASKLYTAQLRRSHGLSNSFDDFFRFPNSVEYYSGMMGVVAQLKRRNTVTVTKIDIWYSWLLEFRYWA